MIVLNSPARGSAFLVMLALAGLSAGCAANRGSAAAEPASVENRRAVMEKETKHNSRQRAPDTDPPATEGSGEVPPQIVALLVDDLARRALVKPETIKVVSATEHTWSDASLGCAAPDSVAAQIIMPGYRVVLQAAQNNYDYHASRDGHFVLCSNGMPSPPVKQQVKGKPPAE